MSSALIAGIAAALVLVAALVLWLWKRRRRPSIVRTLSAIAIERISDVVVPDGMDGEIHIEHLLLTARGVLILNVKRYEGVVFASDRMDQWTVIGAAGRLAFSNPLPSLYDRVAAVRQLVRDIDVTGLVVFPATADFSKGQPDDVMLPEELLASYAKPDKTEVGRLLEAFSPYWDTLKQAARPAKL